MADFKPLLHYKLPQPRLLYCSIAVCTTQLQTLTCHVYEHILIRSTHKMPLFFSLIRPMKYRNTCFYLHFYSIFLFFTFCASKLEDSVDIILPCLRDSWVFSQFPFFAPCACNIILFWFIEQIWLGYQHGLRTPSEGINQRYLKNWADAADKICFGRT